MPTTLARLTNGTTTSVGISRAKRVETRQKRLAQMLDELEHGDVYMKMEWSG